MVVRVDVTDKTFSFFRSDGARLAAELHLCADGSVGGGSHGNESFWDIRGDDLVFLSDEREITTRFVTELRHEGLTLFLGIYLPLGGTETVHLLWESRGPEILTQTWHDHYGSLQSQTHALQQTINLISRRTAAGHRGKIRVMFLVHALETWDSLAEVHAAMLEAGDFEVIVGSSPRRLPGEHSFGHEDVTHRGLTDLGVRHLRLGCGRPEEAVEIIKMLDPAIIFRQSPWENDIPEAFGASALSFTRLCYVPYYGFNLLAQFATGSIGEPDYYADQIFHRLCWRIFCETDETKAVMQARSMRRGDNVVVTGHPKLDRLSHARGRPEWPINGQQDLRRLIWAPHHSIGHDWLGFGTFVEAYEEMLAWAREDPLVSIVLKPHPALFTRIRGEHRHLAGAFETFLGEWRALPNTTVVEGGDYGPLLAASDAMLTDGISFLAEYQLFGKPLLFFDSGRHAPFNDIGMRIVAGAERVTSVRQAREVLSLRCGSRSDPRAATRAAIVREILPFAGESAGRILDEIRRGLTVDGDVTSRLPRDRAFRASTVDTG